VADLNWPDTTYNNDMASRRGSSSEKVDKCGECMKQATDNDKGIQCKMCENWHYVVCECISDEAYS